MSALYQCFENFLGMQLNLFSQLMIREVHNECDGKRYRAPMIVSGAGASRRDI